MGTTTDGATVIVQFDEFGELIYYVTGDVRLFIVDERAPHDRVYEWTSRDTPEGVAEILGRDPIGCRGDERHAAAANLIQATQERRPHLSIVPSEGDQS